jgi:hypothetical protein
MAGFGDAAVLRGRVMLPGRPVRPAPGPAIEDLMLTLRGAWTN